MLAAAAAAAAAGAAAALLAAPAAAALLLHTDRPEREGEWKRRRRAARGVAATALPYANGGAAF